MAENTGKRMVIAILRSRGIHVPRHRVRDIFRRIDPINTALRWRAMHPRYQYDVPGPNALWQIDGYHKLIRWGFVVHGGIDGFSRLVVFLKCATNNRAETVMSTFMDGTRRYGIPSRVRSDHGGENADVGRFMESIRGRDRGSHIQGSSVHNQRIERLHRDTTPCCLSSFYTVFDHMDNEGILDLSNDTVNKTVTVLEAKCPLSEDQISILKGEIDPLSNSINFAVDIYLRTVHCVARILGSSQSHCLKTRGSTPALVFFFFRRGLYAEGSLRFRFAFFLDDDYMLIAFLLLTCPF